MFANNKKCVYDMHFLSIFCHVCVVQSLWGYLGLGTHLGIVLALATGLVLALASGIILAIALKRTPALALAIAAALALALDPAVAVALALAVALPVMGSSRPPSVSMAIPIRGNI